MPATYEDPAKYGRITKIMALTVRARMLLFAASPLVNGNPWYKDYRNKSGELIFNPTYDPQKWVKAAEACKLCIDEAEKAVMAETDRLMGIQGKRSVDSLHKELGHIMWEYVGMGRTKEGLEEGLKQLKALREEFNSNLFIPGKKEGLNVELDKAIHLRDFILMGELVAYDALHREESCGGHFREEHQTEEGEAKRDDENFFYVGCWEYQGDDTKTPELIKEPLEYEAIKVQTRNYKN